MNAKHLALWLGLALWAVAPGSAEAEMTTKERTISVSATGSVAATPDSAEISIGVISEAKSAKEALDRNAKAMAAVLAAIRGLGVASEDIATERFQISPIYSSSKSSVGDGQRIDGFRVHNVAEVRARDIALTGPVIDRATDAGANYVGSIEFAVSGMDAKLDDARRSAMRDAIRRAKLYASAAGATLGDVISISEQIEGQVRPRLQMGRAAAMSATPIEAGQQQLRVTIHGVWALK